MKWPQAEKAGNHQMWRGKEQTVPSPPRTSGKKRPGQCPDGLAASERREDAFPLRRAARSGLLCSCRRRKHTLPRSGPQGPALRAPPHGPEQPGGAGPPCPGLTGALSGRHTSHGPSPRAAVSFPGDTQLSLAFLPLGAGAQCLSAPGRVCEDSQTPFHRRHGNLGTGRHVSDLPCVPSLVRRGFEGGICHLTQYPERPSATLPLRQGRPRPTFSRPWHPPKSALRLPLAVLAPESCAAACLGEEPERIDSQTL